MPFCSVIKDKGTVYIKDISTVVREVSEKTIQRELQTLVLEGIITKKGPGAGPHTFLLGQSSFDSPASIATIAS